MGIFFTQALDRSGVQEDSRWCPHRSFVPRFRHVLQGLGTKKNLQSLHVVTPPFKCREGGCNTVAAEVVFVVADENPVQLSGRSRIPAESNGSGLEVAGRMFTWEQGLPALPVNRPVQLLVFRLSQHARLLFAKKAAYPVEWHHNSSLVQQKNSKANFPR